MAVAYCGSCLTWQWPTVAVASHGSGLLWQVRAQQLAQTWFIGACVVNLAANVHLEGLAPSLGLAAASEAVGASHRPTTEQGFTWMYYTFLVGMILSAVLTATIAYEWRKRLGLLLLNFVTSAAVLRLYIKDESRAEQALTLAFALASGLGIASLIERNHRQQAIEV